MGVNVPGLEAVEVSENVTLTRGVREGVEDRESSVETVRVNSEDVLFVGTGDSVAIKDGVGERRGVEV